MAAYSSNHRLDFSSLPTNSIDTWTLQTLRFESSDHNYLASLDISRYPTPHSDCTSMNLLSKSLLLLVLVMSCLRFSEGQSLALLSEQVATSNMTDSNSVEPSIQVSEQEKIDSIVKALKHLPSTELHRLNVSLEQTILAGSVEAILLQEAWNFRQMEIREALKSMVQPMEVMLNITLELRNFTDLSTAHLVASLESLESLLSDIDNARDFHTQGLWRDLVLTLSNDRPMEVRAGAAWAIGSAVKNSYDYQLWVLEEVEGSSCLDLLLSALNSDSDKSLAYNELLKKVFYAISSASRGNVDVGEALLVHPMKFLDRMFVIASSERYSRGIVRKIWTYVADQLEERKYIRFTLPSSTNLTSTQLEDLMSVNLLGDHFISKEWIDLATRTVARYSAQLKTLTSVEGESLRHCIIFLHEVSQQSEASLDEDSWRSLADSLMKLSSQQDNTLADEIRPLVASMTSLLNQL